MPLRDICTKDGQLGNSLELPDISLPCQDTALPQLASPHFNEQPIAHHWTLLFTALGQTLFNSIFDTDITILCDR